MFALKNIACLLRNSGRKFSSSVSNVTVAESNGIRNIILNHTKTRYRFAEIFAAGFESNYKPIS